jgi:23S rRNA (adenine2503-C2)-methyltransferase
MLALSGFSIAALERHLAARGFRPANARRILRAWYDSGGQRPLTLNSLPRQLIEHLQRDFVDLQTQTLQRETSTDGTTKLLIGCTDAQRVECVLMPDYRPDRAAGCISTQAGCAMGCDFCATAQRGFARHLTTAEILEQAMHLRREAATQPGRRLRTLVFMGMGEPLLNYDNVAEAVKRLACDELGALGWRQLTISTVGLPAAMRRLADEALGVQLAVSLHAPDDATRQALMPAARSASVAEVIAAADYYQQKSGRPVTLQYCLLAGVNDSLRQAAALAALAAPRRMHVNLLLYSETGPGLSGRHYRRPSDARIDQFVTALREGGAVAHIRRSRGSDIRAACGQLRAAAEP